MKLFLFLVVASAQVSYDEEKALRELELAEAAYCITASHESTDMLPSGAELVEIVSNVASGGNALVGFDTTDSTLFVAYRGSENLRNWIENAKFFKTAPYPEKYPEIHVERGFLDWYRSLNRAGLLEAVEKASEKYSTKRLKITGHSAGSACATLFAFELSAGFLPLDSYQLVKLTTFGSPRVGNSHFVSLYNTFNIQTTRVTHYHDLVPHLPQERLEFLHVPTEVYYNEVNSRHKVCDGSGEDPSCSDKCAPFHCTSVDDHLYYINKSLGSDACSVSVALQSSSEQ